MKARVNDLCSITDRLFSSRQSLLALWQEIAEHFYVERADFTSGRSLGEDYAAHLMSGGPAMIRRELADQIATMTRPRGKVWFTLAPSDDSRVTPEVEKWAKEKSGLMYRAMYDPKSRYTRASKEDDNDYCTFGQAVKTVEVNEDTMTLLYRNWHLRDVVWKENDKLEIDTIARNWKIQARDMCNNPRWAGKVDSKAHDLAERDPHLEIQCRHIIVPYDEYDYNLAKNGGKKTEPYRFMSLLVDRENERVLEETPLYDHPYIISRWQTVSGSQYAHSPATVIALPDARALQAITSTLLEAGERATNPPMIAVQGALRSDLALFPGGATWVDAAYDERLGEVLRPVNMDWSGLKFGYEMADKHEEMIRQAFYLNKIMLPAFDGAAMTATEIRARTEEYIRGALPLFEPIEAERSGQDCEKTWNLMMRYGAFGSPKEWPRELSGADMKWTFTSPLTGNLDKEEATTFQETAQLLAIANQIDPSLRHEYDALTHFRRAMKGLGAPMVSEEEADARREQAAQMAQVQEAISMAGQGGAAASQVGQAVKNFSEAGMGDMEAAA